MASKRPIQDAAPEAGSTVLVTGGLGFIGSHVVEVLLERGHKVVILDDESSGHNHNTHPNCKEVIGDLTDIKILDSLPDTIRFVVHLGAAISVAESMKMPEKYYRINAEGSKTVLEWAAKRGVQKMVSASTAAYYGDPKEIPVKEEFPYGGISPYADAKEKMEEYHALVFKERGLSSTCCRFFNVYGPRQDPKSQYSGVISKFLFWGVRKESMCIFGDGGATRDFVYVRDVVDAVLTALFAGDNAFTTFNVGTGKTTTVLELADAVAKACASTTKHTFLPTRDGDILDSCAAVEKIKKALGFVASVSLEDGLASTKQWFVESGAAK